MSEKKQFIWVLGAVSFFACIIAVVLLVTERKPELTENTFIGTFQTEDGVFTKVLAIDFDGSYVYYDLQGTVDSGTHEFLDDVLKLVSTTGEVSFLTLGQDDYLFLHRGGKLNLKKTSSAPVYMK